MLGDDRALGSLCPGPAAWRPIPYIRFMHGAATCLVAALVMMFAGPGAAAQPTCSPAATNTTCATSVALAVNATCVNGTTCQGGAQSASTCLYAGSQCVWYRFTATASAMYVNIDLTATSGCHISSNVYRSTGPCAGLTQVSCLSGAPLDDMHPLTGLTIGTTYYIQVCYSPGGPCGNNGSAQFCIEVGIPDPPCSTCATPCGDAYGYSSTPTVAQVVADCQSERFRPPLQPGATHTFCNSFTATSTTVSFNVVITSDCGAGNVTAFSWALYSSPACGGALQTGTLANLSFTGLTVGGTYVFCYTFTVPANCTHTQHCPYFVGATTPLPVTWLMVDAQAKGPRRVDVLWATGSETNTSHFVVERSKDAVDYEPVTVVPAAGQSATPISYRAEDHTPHPGLSFYRVLQMDQDGSSEPSIVVPVMLEGAWADVTVRPDPATGEAWLMVNAHEAQTISVILHDASGRMLWKRTTPVSEGLNELPLGTSELAPGIYLIGLEVGRSRTLTRFLRP